MGAEGVGGVFDTLGGVVEKHHTALHTGDFGLVGEAGEFGEKWEARKRKRASWTMRKTASLARWLP